MFVNRPFRLAMALFVGIAGWARSCPGDDELVAEARHALYRACDFFRDKVACNGGYLWQYSEDLTHQEGEGIADDTIVWVQPPGTPTVGAAFLEAYELSGDNYFLTAAREAGNCLIRGQLRSGGWDYRIEFDPASRRRYAYRVDPVRTKSRNTTTLDDNTTQSALRLLMQLDQALEFKDAEIHEATEFALSALLKSQYPNGAWPQRFDGPPIADQFPVLRANYPESWSRTWVKKDYRSHYTFNDNAIADTIDVMLMAARIYNDPKFMAAATRAGDFLLLAQMPDPQPGWAQQYNARMQPAWARKFEPPAITGGESGNVIKTLLRMYRETGHARYLEPIPRALAYYQKLALPDGRLARFYELKTNRPLYFTTDYELTYDDSDLPTHYGFKVSNWVDSVAKQYEKAKALKPEQRNVATPPRKPKNSPALEARVRGLIAGLNENGAWTESGKLKSLPSDGEQTIITSRTFARNIVTLSTYLAAVGQ